LEYGCWELNEWEWGYVEWDSLGQSRWGSVSMVDWLTVGGLCQNWGEDGKNPPH